MQSDGVSLLTCEHVTSGMYLLKVGASALILESQWILHVLYHREICFTHLKNNHYCNELLFYSLAFIFYRNMTDLCQSLGNGTWMIQLQLRVSQWSSTKLGMRKEQVVSLTHHKNVPLHISIKQLLGNLSL